jgi:general nucleoside transport system permease protein
MSGLAGAMMPQGDQYVLKDGFTSGYGFDGLPIGLARGTGIGVILAALFFGFLRSDGINMEMTAQVPSAAATIIQGLAIIAIAASGFWLVQNEGKRRPLSNSSDRQAEFRYGSDSDSSLQQASDTSQTALRARSA